MCVCVCVWKWSFGGVAGRNITQAQVVWYGDSIVAHIGIYSCMFSLSLCCAVTDAFATKFLFEYSIFKFHFAVTLQCVHVNY